MDRKNVAAIYELTPMQLGMFFHSRYGSEGGVYLTQFDCVLEGPLDTDAFRRAWQQVLARHPVLRSSFHWQKLDRPLQVVHREVDLPLEVLDWRNLTTQEQEAEIRALRTADRRRGFVLDQAPLMRWVVIRLEDERQRLLWSHHHLLLDGWSVGVVLREVVAIYTGLRTGRPLPLPPPRPYKEFILWLKEQDHEGAEAYWRELLAGFTEPTPIGFEGGGVLAGAEGEPEPDEVDRSWVEPGYGREVAQFGPELTSRLEAAARGSKVTVNTLFQGAWALLLARAAGTREAVFGATTSGRPPELAGVDQRVGLFINTLPVRVEIPGGRQITSWLQDLQLQQSRSRRHEWTPLADIQKWSQVPGGQGLFDSLVVFENLPSEGGAGAEGGLRVLSAGFIQRSNFTLTLAVSPRDGALDVRVAFPLDRIERSTARVILRQLEAVLQTFAEASQSSGATGVASGNATRLGQIDFLTPEQRQEWRDTSAARRREIPGSITIPGLIAEQAARDPEATAVLGAGREVSFGELMARVAHLAARLRAAGAEPDRPVAIALPRSLETVVAVLAAMEIGSGYLPLDPAYPRERLELMLEDTGVTVAVAHPSTRGIFEGLGRDLTVIEGEELGGLEVATGVATGADASIEAPAGSGEHLAYVIYTSGSTGTPKGVMVSQRALVSRVLGCLETFRLEPGDRQLHFVSLSFDVAAEELFPPLVAGAAVVVEPGIERRAPGEVLALCDRLRVTKANLPTAYWHQMVDELETLDRPAPSTLRILGTGGESMSPEKLRIWSRRARSGGRFFNIYGPTEATVLSSLEEIPMTGEEVMVGERIPIGRVLPNTSHHLVGPELLPVPDGSSGELLIGGESVARGYQARPSLTAERFVPDPFGTVPGARLYRTGDRVRRLADGRYDFLGRVDLQVKVRGYRIEIGEIEEALRRHPGVAQAAVMAREDTPGSRRLVAYVVRRVDEADAEGPGVGDLRAFLGERLPEFMVPAAFVFLEALPLTPNNKVDRRALPAPTGDRPDLDEEYLAPRTALESFLAELWQEILGVDTVGARDGFFELGGDSIKGAIFINRLEAELGEYVYVVALFDAPTIEGFARYLSGHCPRAVEERFGADSLTAGATADLDTGAGVDRKLDLQDLRKIEERIEPLQRRAASKSARNPRAVFVLSPPRSGSTLFRVLLAGHPGLFAPPELDVLSFDTLAERRAEFSGRWSFWLEGTLRALMEIEGSDAEVARALMGRWEEEGWTAKQFYGEFQRRLGHRLLVDKTPSYALDPEVLRRAEEDFDRPLFIHLLRHPCGMVRSFEKARIDELFYRHEHPYSPRQLGELMWNLCHRNILDFLAEVPASRQHRLRFEDLVEDPEETLSGLCDFLGVELVPAMLDPYASKSGRMTDGIHPLAKMLGDVKFHEHRAIDPAVAWRWREAFDRDVFGAMTWELAARFGYRPPERWGEATDQPTIEIPVQPRGADGEGRFPLSFAQQRLFVLDRLTPGNAGYNMPVALRLSGPLDPERLERALVRLVRRHETLRTRLVTEEGETWQDVAPRTAFPVRLERVDLGVLSPEKGQRQALELVASEARRPFDLARGPLLRATLIRLGSEEHVLAVVQHHIVSDGWSQGLLLQEWVAFYGEAHELPALKVQYADYAVWQRRRLSGEALETALSWWRETLDGAPEVLELAADRPRPLVPTFRGGRVRLALEPDVAATLRALGKAKQGTLFMVLLAGFGTLLQRWSGQADLVVGSPVAGRSNRHLEGLIGFFVNTLALRLDLARQPRFGELVERVREGVVGALGHQDVPFEKVVEALRPERDTGIQPVFQVAFALQNQPAQPPQRSGIEIEPIVAESHTSKFDLTLSLSEGPDGGLGGSLEYSLDLFDAVTAERWSRGLCRLLAAAGENPDLSLAALPLASRAEQHQLVVEWGGCGPAVHPPAIAEKTGTTLWQAFSRQAATRPDAIAVICGDQALSYGELTRRAARLGERLRQEGAGPEVAVALFPERDLGLVLGVLGISAAGAAYLPMDPAYPTERLRFLLSDAGVRLALVSESLIPVLGPVADGVRILPLTPALKLKSVPEPASASGPELTLEGMDGEARELVSAESLAYIIYTSGSTGRPKGTLIGHRHVGRLLESTQPWFGFGAVDVWTLFHSVAFDFSVWELWGPLTTGGRLVVVPWETSRDPRRFRDLLEAQRITVLNQTPSAFRQLLTEDRARPLRQALRWVIFGGEALDIGDLESWWRNHGETEPRLVNMYGITETTVHVSFRPLSTADLESSWSSVIGRGIPDLDLRVLDPSGRPVPMGVPGELYVGGAGLARGYLGRPSLTASRFVPDPLGVPGARLYRSGDLARWLPGGDLEYLGRIDQQVKIRGFRIELGEIEAALAEHPAVASAKVLVAEGERGEDGAGSEAGSGSERRLAAFVVPEESAAAPLRRLLAWEREGKLERQDLFALGDGTLVAHLNRSETQFLDREIFESNAYLRHGISVRPGDLVLDVGANIGLFSLQAARLGAEVLAFEPIPRVWEALASNFELHGISGEALAMGLGAAEETAEITFYPQVSVISGRFADVSSERQVVEKFLRQQDPDLGERSLDELLDQRLESEQLEVPIRSLSSVLAEREIERIDLLKIDVEKSEMAVLEGIDAEDWAKIRQLVVEVHDLDGCLERLCHDLEDRGFRVQVEEDPELRDTGLFGVFAHRIEAEKQEAAPESNVSGPEIPWSRPEGLEAELRDRARQRLPEYMVPSHWTFLESLPLTANGKIDRRALLALAGRRSRFVAETHEPPLGASEEALAEIFERLLEHPRVSRRDDFFDLGGHSLLAVRLMAEIESRFGRELPLAALFRNGSVMELAKQLEEVGEDRPGSSPLVELQPGSGEGHAVFCVHPAGGNVLCYAELARAFGPDIGVWGLQARGLEPGEAPRRDIGEMAAAYLEALEGAPTELPRILLGWSSGGLVAFEMARRLADAGNPPALLAIVDVWSRPPKPRRLEEGPEGSAGERVALALAGQLELPANELRNLEGEEQLAWVLGRAKEAGVVPAGFGMEEAERYVAVYEANEEAVATFEPGPYETAPAVLFRARQEPPEAAASPDLGWKRWLGPALRIVRVEGSHQTILSPPGVDTVARELLEWISERHSRAPSSVPGDRSERLIPRGESVARVDAID